jgi:hypothetical protein
LPNEDEPRRLKPTAVPGVHGLGAGDHAARGKVVAQERDGMPAQRQTHMAVILHDLTARGHRAQRDYGFFNLSHRLVLASSGRCEERKGLVPKRLDRPKRLTPDETQRG